MKKVLSLLLAVVLVCSMATVAFGLDYTWTCDVCGGETGSAAEYNAHILSGACGTCAHCGKGFSAVKDKDGNTELGTHEYICPKANITCDYCGKVHASEKDFADHIDACKTKYFHIPLARIIAAVKAYIGKIDFKKAFNGAKNFVTELTPYVKDIVATISK